MPAAVDLTQAEYLKKECLYVQADNPSLTWGDRGVDSEIISPIHLKADAQAELARQAAFMAGPLVMDAVQVTGYRRDLLFKVITVTGDQLGYDAGVPCFVIGFQEDAGFTILTVVRRQT